MNIDDRRPTTDLRAYSHSLGKFQMAITLQRVSRSPSCLVLGWVFRGLRIERHRFRFDQIRDGGRRPSWKTSNGHISAMHYPIHCVLYPRSLYEMYLTWSIILSVTEEGAGLREVAEEESVWWNWNAARSWASKSSQFQPSEHWALHRHHRVVSGLEHLID